MAGLKDIAKQTGVSVRTVSRALKNEGYVSQEVRERVLAAADELGYRPNRIARALKTRSSFEIAVLMHVVDELHIAKISGLEQRMRDAGYWVSVLIEQDASQTARMDDIIDELLSRRPAGIAVFSSAMFAHPEGFERILAGGIPYVILAEYEPTLDSIAIDRQQGVYDAINYLVDSGRKRIAYLAEFPKEAKGNLTRFEGYRRAIAERGLQPILLEGHQASDTFESGRQAALELGQRPLAIDAVQAFTDVMALGFLAGLHECGIRVPEDVAVIGFDNRSAAAWASPPLTTVAQPNWEVGTAAADVLLAKIRGERPQAGGWSQALPTTLIVRESA